MSSMLRKFSQIPARVKYLLGVAQATCPEGEISVGELFGAGGASVILVPAGVLGGVVSVATTTELSERLSEVIEDVNPQFCEEGAMIGKLFKDMGRTLTVAAVDGHHIATYRECQLVNGAGSEGVGGAAPEYGSTYFVRVWAADGLGVAVARTG